MNDRENEVDTLNAMHTAFATLHSFNHSTTQPEPKSMAYFFLKTRANAKVIYIRRAHSLTPSTETNR
jgi:hypothetical protein